MLRNRHIDVQQDTSWLELLQDVIATAAARYGVIQRPVETLSINLVVVKERLVAARVDYDMCGPACDEGRTGENATETTSIRSVVDLCMIT